MFDKKPTPSDQGFTLLEIALVLFILLTIAGLAMPATAGLMAQERLKSQAKLLEDYAASARRLAVTEGRAYQVVLKPRGFVLERYPADEKDPDDVVGTVKLPAHVAYTVQRWGAEGFAKPDGESWVFRPDGICEPVRVHFENGDGWIEYSIHPLTAAPRDEASHFP